MSEAECWTNTRRGPVHGPQLSQRIIARDWGAEPRLCQNERVVAHWVSDCRWNLAARLHKDRPPKYHRLYPSSLHSAAAPASSAQSRPRYLRSKQHTIAESPTKVYPPLGRASTTHERRAVFGAKGDTINDVCFAGLFAGNRGIGASVPTHLAHCCLDPNQTPPVATHDKAQSTRSTSSHQIPLASTSGKHPNPHPMGAPPMAVDRKLKKIIPYQKIIGYITLLKNPPQLSPHTRVCGMIRDFNKINNILSIKATIRDTSKNHTLINQQKSNKVTSNLTKTTREHTPITIHTYKN